MKTQRLDKIVADWHRDAEPSASLRARVLNAALQTEPMPAALPTPKSHRRRVWWATGGALALTGAASVMFFAVSTPARPAYAEVETAMAQVKTARWVTYFSTYEVKTGNESKFSVEHAARLSPPALRSGLGGMNYDLVSPNWRDSYYETDKGIFRSRYPTMGRLPGSEKNPVAALQAHIRHQILPPPRVGRLKATTIEATEVVEDGKRLMRYKSRFSSGVKAPGKEWQKYEWTMFADPQTRRAVRVETHSYSHWQHVATVTKDFQWDTPLPNSLFTPPSGARDFPRAAERP